MRVYGLCGCGPSKAVYEHQESVSGRYILAEADNQMGIVCDYLSWANCIDSSADIIFCFSSGQSAFTCCM